jgi:hypothetical protein
MLKKNIDKQKRKERPNQWTGFYTRKTKTKAEKVKQLNKKEFEKVKRGNS